jgi:hypothetical protein
MITPIWTPIHAALAAIWTCAATVAHHLLFTAAGQAAVSGAVIGVALAYMVWALSRKADPR